jgi:hypothetical protein
LESFQTFNQEAVVPAVPIVPIVEDMTDVGHSRAHAVVQRGARTKDVFFSVITREITSISYLNRFAGARNHARLVVVVRQNTYP